MVGKARASAARVRKSVQHAGACLFAIAFRAPAGYRMPQLSRLTTFFTQLWIESRLSSSNDTRTLFFLSFKTREQAASSANQNARAPSATLGAVAVTQLQFMGTLSLVDNTGGEGSSLPGFTDSFRCECRANRSLGLSRVPQQVAECYDYYQVVASKTRQLIEAALS